jgi:hypothetical protein
MSRVARSAGARSKTARAGANCSSSCKAKDHVSWGECVRSKGLQLSPAVNDGYGTRQKAWDRELDNYESAVRQGLSPAGTQQHHVDAAFREAESA